MNCKFPQYTDFRFLCVHTFLTKDVCMLSVRYGAWPGNYQNKDTNLKLTVIRVDQNDIKGN